MFVIKHYVIEHSCLLGATTNRSMATNIVANMSGEVTSYVSFINHRHLKQWLGKSWEF